ncbi:MAG: methyltransferase domain-containing protein [Methanothrix sp.]|jgi:cyclopropane fatty-acyl-phospholipid synthase-like methyltransferase|uniref:class I SAM-dependent methyltransferase n=1 Tax=Methanothrix sp. TaxID=90426 RepID=UPI00247BF35D|nr:methyltransferase domain-containing protein [Methanothrix sp.]
MHQQLSTVAAELWGVDVDAEGIAFLRNQGFDHLIVGDVCNLDRIQELQGEVFDVIVASEVLEHLVNPGLFLTAVKNAMVPGRTELIVTVPNAFRVSTLIQLLRGIEYVHPDHNYWFSYATLTGLLKKTGFEIREVYVYSFESAQILPRRIGKFVKRDDSGIAPHVKKSRNRSAVWTQMLGYLRSLPRRLLVGALYRRTPFWADGIIVIATRPKNEA